MSLFKSSPFKISNLIFLFILSLYPSVFAGAPDTLWTRAYGGTGSDETVSLEITSDDGFILLGNIFHESPARTDYWLIRTDSHGDSLWTKTYGGIKGDWGTSVREISNGDFILAGNSYSYGVGVTDLWLIRVNSNGDSVWTKTFGRGGTDRASCVLEVSDSGFVLLGHMYNGGSTSGHLDLWFIRTDSQGDSLWVKQYGDNGVQTGNSVIETSDGGFILLGETRKEGALHFDMWLIKTDAHGDSLWTKTYGESGSDRGHSVQKTKDGGLILLGDSYYTIDSSEIVLIKTDMHGDSLWTKKFNKEGITTGASVCETSDGGFLITGNTRAGEHEDTDIIVIKTNANGDSLWTKIIGGSKDDCGYSVKETPDRGVVILGTTQSFGEGASDAWLIRLKPDTASTEVDHYKAPKLTNTISIYNNPNPFSAITTITYSLPVEGRVVLSLCDPHGKRVESLDCGIQEVGSYSITWDATGLGGGLYICKLALPDKNIVARKKILLLK